MSPDIPLSITFAEKIIALALIIFGAITAFNSIEPPAGDLSHFSGIFLVIGVVVAAAGLFLFIAKSE